MAHDLDLLARAEEAQRLLSSDLLWSLLADMEAEQVEAWAASGQGEAEQRESAWHRVAAIRDLRGKLQGELDELKKAERRAGRS